MFDNWLSITRLKILGARILYKFTVLFAGSRRRIIEREGVKYEVDLSEGIEFSLFLFGKFQAHITKNPFLAIPPDAVILDVGANVGLMTLQFANLAQKGQVYAFEPTFYALERLRKNLSLNPRLSDHVTVINSFVSAESHSNPSIVAYSSWKVDGSRGEADHPIHLGTPKSAEGVPAISLDDFAKKENLQRLDFIKIDTDGHEYEVLQGGKEAISRFRPKIIFEIGLYLLDEKNIGYDFYDGYFSSLNYRLVDTKTGVAINLRNYPRYIPKKGSTDLIALPL
jgi:FkbM family methyltransferase